MEIYRIHHEILEWHNVILKRAQLIHTLTLRKVSVAGIMLVGILAAFFSMPVRANDNVIALEEHIEYILQGDNGKLVSVKKNSETKYTAQRVDDNVMAFEMFGEHVTIDKASAPGAKPYYRSWEPEDMFHTGSRICVMSVPVGAGKQAKVSFATTIKWPEQFCNIYLRSPYFTRSSTVKVIIPEALASRYGVLPYRLPENMSLDKSVGKNGETIYTVVAKERRAIRSEDGAPSLAIDCPQLIITGHFADTDVLYSYLKGFVDDSSQNSESVANLSRRLTSGCSSPLAMIDSVAAWVRQNIRYVAIENGEYALRPSSANEVLERRYGDCKGSANLIKALLRQSGIDARLVWTGTIGEVTTDWETNPSLMSGNHQIACAVLPDTVVYIDGTVGYASDGFVPEPLRGAKVIIEDGEHCMVTAIPDASRDIDGETIEARFAVEGNDLVGSVRCAYTGSERVGIVSTWNRLDPADRRTFQERLLTYPKKNMSAVDLKFELESLSAAQCIVSSEKVNDRQAVRKVGEKLYIGLQPFRLPGLDPVETHNRSRGLAPLCASAYTAEIVLELPEGYVVERLPEAAVIDNEWYKGTVEYTEKDSEIVCCAKLKRSRKGVPIGKLEAYNDIMKSINRISNNQLILKCHEK